MGLDDWLDRIGSLHPKSWDLGLDRIREVAARLDLLHIAPRVITVAGTNGKGSTCEVIAALCAAQGLRAGKTTSPHLVRFNERIVVDGEAASDLEICDAFATIDQARGEISLTYFEFAALAAFYIFKQHQVDVAILEVGLGGRLDAMNLIDADVAVITRIALDHQAWLGDNREQIALEKAGIMRAHRPVVIADEDPPQALLKAARELQAPVYAIGREFGFDAEGGAHVTHEGKAIRYSLERPVNLPRQSLEAGWQAAVLAGIDVASDTLAETSRSLRLAGRFHEISAPRRTVFDVGHNPDAAAWLAARLAGIRKDRCLAVFGMYQDKDHAEVIASLVPHVDAWYVCQVNEPRAAPASALAGRVSTLGGSVVGTYDKVAVAYDQALGDSAADDIILVFGSFPVVGAVMEHLGVPV